jgi:hypothetical protein
MPPEPAPEVLPPHPAASTPTAASATSATSGRRRRPDLLGGGLVVPFQTRTWVPFSRWRSARALGAPAVVSPVSSRPWTDDDAPAACCRRGEHQTSPPGCRKPGLPASSNRHRFHRHRDPWTALVSIHPVGVAVAACIPSSLGVRLILRLRAQEMTHRGGLGRAGGRRPPAQLDAAGGREFARAGFGRRDGVGFTRR